MALGGGTWTAQNKVLPGAYINFVSAARAGAELSERGIVACPLLLDWGPEGKVITVTEAEFRSDSQKLFGYTWDAAEMLPVRELFRHARILHAYRIGTGAVKASNTYATAKYGGTRGNDLKTVIAVNSADNTKYDVTLYLGTVVVDKQTVASAAGLVPCDYADYKTDAALAVTAGTSLSGGTDVTTITTAMWQAVLDAYESYSFNVLCCPDSTSTTVELFEAYTERMRDDIGAKFQLVAYQSDADYEGCIGVWSAVTATGSLPSAFKTALACYWVAGAEAGCAVNKSLTNAKYDGELTIGTAYTQAQLEAAIKAGKFLFHSVNGAVRVLEDINTLVTYTDEKSETFASNQTVRVCDQIANDVAGLFNTRYLGIVANDKSGREALWSDVVRLIRSLEGMRAVEDFDDGTVSCERGEAAGSVVLTIAGLSIINAMSKLYMSVIVS